MTVKLTMALGLGLAGALGLGVQQASAEALEDLQHDSAAVEMQADDIVAARRAAFWLSTQAVAQVKANTEEGGNLGRARFAATRLAEWAEALPAMFPEGSQTEGSRALPTVWSDRAGFEAAAEAYRAAAQNVADIAETGDHAAANAAFMEMAATCHSCHETYRASP